MNSRYLPLLLLAGIMAVALAGPASAATFEVSLNVNAQSFTDHYNNQNTGFLLFPYVAVLEDGSSTQAYVEFSNPSGDFSGFENHPLGYASSSTHMFDTNDLVSNANGTWNLLIEQEGTTYEYAVEVTFGLPFEVLPYITSNTLMNGAPLGNFEWSLHGGSEEYLDSSSDFSVSLEVFPDNGQTLASALLPPDATSWDLPGDVDYSVSEEFLATISLRMPTYDYSAFQISSVQPLSPDAPELIFTSTTVEYGADFSATLINPVPEPSTAILAMFSGITLLGMAIRRKLRKA